MAKTVTPETHTSKIAPLNVHALDMIEQAFYLLKKLPTGTLFLYYLGTMPFMTGILYFFNDMSKNAFAHEYCLAASLGLVFLFIWCKFWQALFCTRTYEHIGEYPKRSWSLGLVMQIITTQTIVHTSALITLPIASFILVPFAWTFAMYQMVLVQNDPNIGIKAQLKKDFAAATNYTFVNHMLISVLSLFALFVFFNVAIAIYTLPFLTKSLFGIESGFTMGGFNVLNTTFLLSAACITHLLVDPLFKIVYTLQKYNDLSQRTGDDLISGLNRIKKTRRIPPLIPVVLIFIFLTGIPLCHAADSRQTGTQTLRHTLTPKELDKAVKKVLSQREYAWRLPGETIKKPDEPRGFIYTALKWVASQLKSAGEAIADWFEKFYGWFKKLFKKQETPPEPKSPESLIKPKYLAAGLIVLVIILLSAILLHLKKLKPQKTVLSENTDKTVVDINDENILADQLPGDQWLTLAKDLLDKNELRLAIRALYLGTLAQLADRHLVKIARHKSNRDYQLELSLKNPEPQTLVDDFIRLVQTVDSVWYGMHAVTQDMVDDFLSTRQRMVHVAGW